MPVSSIWTGLLFLHGHIRDPRLAHRLERLPLHPTGRDARLPAPRVVLATLCARLRHGIGDGFLRMP
jgi:hypothetical protein